MIRYKAADPSKNDKRLRQTLRDSYPYFIAYCLVRQACRTLPAFRRDGHYVIGIVVPEGANLGLFRKAAEFAVYGSAAPRSNGRSAYVEMAATETRKTDSDLTDALSDCRRVVLVARNEGCLPDVFRHGADAIVHIGPITPKLVIAGASFCLRLAVTPEQADYIATVPLDVVASAFRPGRSVDKAMAIMRRVTEGPARPRKDVTGPTLNDLHGLGEAGEWGRELATDLADWKAGKIGWTEVDRGILVSGPPGTGKTTFAGALARTSGAHLVLGSLGRWQAKGHLGDLLKAMRSAFEEARRNVPSIVFIDEIDAVGDRRNFGGYNADYSMQVVAALLECIDGAESREGIVVVGACNYPERLDPALVRAGRLDRHVKIPLPDAKAREGILRWHLQGQLSGADLSGIVACTEGWSGASLEQLVRSARRVARRARRELEPDDLAAGLPASIELSAPLVRRMAVHEAGHAVTALVLDAADVIEASIKSVIIPGAQTIGGGVLYKDRALFGERTGGQWRDQITVMLAGTAAEEAILGERSGGAGGEEGSDLHSATLIAATHEASYGFGEGLAFLSPRRDDQLLAALRSDPFLRSRVEKLLAAQYVRAAEIVDGHRREIELVAEALIARGTLTGGELRDLFAGQLTLPVETVGHRDIRPGDRVEVTLPASEP